MSQSPTSPDLEAGKRFHLIRKFLKLNQTEMAQICGISQPMVVFIEKGTREIPTSVLKRLFLEKNISPTYVIADGEDMVYNKPKETPAILIRSLTAEVEVIKAEINEIKKQIKR